MQQPTFQFVEHYLQFIGGYRDYKGKPLGLFENVPPPVSLARYDVQILNSLCSQTGEMNRALTDRQAELAVKLIEKYKRQLGNLSPSVILPEVLDKFELGIRVVDRSKSVWVEKDKICVKFPYDTNLISTVRKLIVEGQGSVQFIDDVKIWKLELTEYMINWVMNMLPKFDFKIDDQIKELYHKILEIENQNFQIILRSIDDQIVIENANGNLLQYIENHVGNLCQENIVKLVDQSSTLGYEVEDQLKNLVKAQYSDLYEFFANRQINLTMSEKTLETVMFYAKLTNRLPVYFYDTGIPKQDTDQIVYINKKAPDNLEPKLLVTRSPMMIGAKKQSWLVSAEKIIVLT